MRPTIDIYGRTIDVYGPTKTDFLRSLANNNIYRYSYIYFNVFILLIFVLITMNRPCKFCSLNQILVFTLI